jgi:hypothetical protein
MVATTLNVVAPHKLSDGYVTAPFAKFILKGPPLRDHETGVVPDESVAVKRVPALAVSVLGTALIELITGLTAANNANDVDPAPAPFVAVTVTL